MEVILKEDIVNLGKIGEIVRVRDGYARNYLLPRGLVLEANKKNMKTFEHHKKIVGDQKQKIVRQAQSVGDQLNGVSLVIPMSLSAGCDGCAGVGGTSITAAGGATTRGGRASANRNGFRVGVRNSVCARTPYCNRAACATMSLDGENAGVATSRAGAATRVELGLDMPIQVAMSPAPDTTTVDFQFIGAAPC